jgi:hypothetical protein
MNRFAYRPVICSCLAAFALLVTAGSLDTGARAQSISPAGPSLSPGQPGRSISDSDKLDDTLGAAESYSIDRGVTANAGAPSSDQTRARNAGAKGAVRPFGWILKKVRKAAPGDVVRVSLKQRQGDLWTYEITVLSDSGRYVQLSLNAATGAILSRKNR